MRVTNGSDMWALPLGSPNFSAMMRVSLEARLSPPKARAPNGRRPTAVVSAHLMTAPPVRFRARPSGVPSADPGGVVNQKGSEIVRYLFGHRVGQPPGLWSF